MDLNENSFMKNEIKEYQKIIIETFEYISNNLLNIYNHKIQKEIKNQIVKEGVQFYDRINDSLIMKDIQIDMQ